MLLLRVTKSQLKRRKEQAAEQVQAKAVNEAVVEEMVEVSLGVV